MIAYTYVLYTLIFMFTTYKIKFNYFYIIRFSILLTYLYLSGNSMLFLLIYDKKNIGILKYYHYISIRVSSDY